MSLGGDGYASGQQKAEGNHASVEGAGVVFVLLHYGAVQAHAGKEAAGSRVGQDLGAHGDIGHALGEASDRAGCSRCVRAYLEVAGEQGLHAVLVHHQHDQVNRLSAGLEAEAAAFNAEECGRAPAVGVAAGDHAFTQSGAEDEAALDHGRDNGNAFGRIHDLLRNAAVGRGHHVIEHLCGRLQPFDIFFTIVGQANCGERKNYESDENG